MTAEQDEMLERFCERHGFGIWVNPETQGFTDKRGLAGENWRFEADDYIMNALRELLRAVQEADAKAAEFYDGKFPARFIREQTYSDLFPEEEK